MNQVDARFISLVFYRALPHTLVVQTLPIVPATIQTAIIVSTATFNSVLIQHTEQPLSRVVNVLAGLCT